MLSACVVVSMLAVAFAAGPVDKNCTTSDGTDDLYNNLAVMCDNTLEDVVCATLYDPAVILNDKTERPEKCFMDKDSAPSEAVKQAALNSCPKTCGYCCQAPAYSCKNADYPRTQCNTVTQTQCKDPKWRSILAADCPAVCGFCLEGGCVDNAIECKNDPAICRHVDMQDFVKVNCQRTCGYCPAIGSTTRSPSGGCTDINKNCANWNNNGYCRSTFYTDSNKRENCAKTCGLC